MFGNGPIWKPTVICDVVECKTEYPLTEGSVVYIWRSVNQEKLIDLCETCANLYPYLLMEDAYGRIHKKGKSK
jgi:hypothetical protein